MPSHMHRPGRPEDLPHPRTLWAHGALNALVCAALGKPTDTWLLRYWLTEGKGLGHDDSGGNWWNLKPHPEGRAVLYGADHEMSKTRGHKPPIDLVAGAPDWLDRDWFHANDDMIGYVYWFDAASWQRVPYPDDVMDDGLELTAGQYLTAEQSIRPRPRHGRSPRPAHPRDLPAPLQRAPAPPGPEPAPPAAQEQPAAVHHLGNRRLLRPRVLKGLINEYGYTA